MKQQEFVTLKLEASGGCLRSPGDEVGKGDKLGVLPVGGLGRGDLQNKGQDIKGILLPVSGQPVIIRCGEFERDPNADENPPIPRDLVDENEIPTPGIPRYVFTRIDESLRASHGTLWPLGLVDGQDAV